MKTYKLEITIASEQVMQMQAESHGYTDGDSRADLVVREAENACVTLGREGHGVELTQQGELKLHRRYPQGWVTRTIGLKEWLAMVGVEKAKG